jgi:mono/diheme cytochrome c family protein
MKNLIFAAAVMLFVSSIQAVDFAKDIQPILESRCVKCHGEKKQKGEYRLSNAKSFMKAGESEEKPVVAGKPDASYMVKLISMTDEDDDVMPPKGGTLTKDQIANVKAWIKDGAKFPAGVELKDKSPKKKKK